MCVCVCVWRSGGKSESTLILTLFYKFWENNVKREGWLIVNHLMALIAERQGGTCTNRVSLEATFLFLRDRGKTVYILPSLYRTLALLLLRFTDYYDAISHGIKSEDYKCYDQSLNN
ncbi:hypothetical protein Hanom_Chr11g00971441 [Helianthus anomalus]